MKETMVFILLLTSTMVPVTKCSIPGTFFWKPRMAVDLSVPTTENFKALRAIPPTKENIRKGVVVLIDGFEMGLTVICFGSGMSASATYPYFNPLKSNFYTDAYRWILRYFNLLPFWFKGQANVVDSTKLWRRRFYNSDALIPQWIRHIILIVPKAQWEREDADLKKFKKHAMIAFSKHLRYPSKTFNNFKSFETEETLESKSSLSST